MRIKLSPQYQYAGVYMIRNEKNGKVYIGSSCDIETRLCMHRSRLAHGKHSCRDLQADYDHKHPFTAHVLYVEAVPRNNRNHNRRRIYAMEWHFIEKYNAIENGYNTMPIDELCQKAL